ncbi:MAG: glycine/sarcosine/betaine reductase selenoprotein B family protein [Thermodesulfobacteriota bacterium]
MTHHDKGVDGFKFMPKSLRSWLGKSIPETEFSGHIPWTPMEKPVDAACFALLTSAGISMKDQAPFDMEREKKEPLWGDPSYRMIPKTASTEDIDMNHLHVNTDYVKQDINVMLPIHRFAEFERQGRIGRLAQTHYSVYGYQLDAKALMETSMPAIAEQMKAEGVDAAVLTPT